MSDIIGETDGLGLVLYSGTRDELQAKLRKRDDEITRLRSLLKDREWRDISTAPKDGTQFLVMHHDWQRPAVACYCLDADRFIFAEDALAEIDGGTFELEGCHYMPLPPPPTREGKDMR
jgi:hypothetical protein